MTVAYFLVTPPRPRSLIPSRVSRGRADPPVGAPTGASPVRPRASAPSAATADVRFPHAGPPSAHSPTQHSAVDYPSRPLGMCIPRSQRPCRRHPARSSRLLPASHPRPSPEATLPRASTTCLGGQSPRRCWLLSLATPLWGGGRSSTGGPSQPPTLPPNANATGTDRLRCRPWWSSLPLVRPPSPRLRTHLVYVASRTCRPVGRGRQTGARCGRPRCQQPVTLPAVSVGLVRSVGLHAPHAHTDDLVVDGVVSSSSARLLPSAVLKRRCRRCWRWSRRRCRPSASGWPQKISRLYENSIHFSLQKAQIATQ